MRHRSSRLIALCLLGAGALAPCGAKSESIYVVKSVRSILITNKQPSASAGRVLANYEVKPHARVWLSNHAPCPIRSKYERLIAREAEAQGLDPALVKAVVHAESAFNACARSPRGAIGLMQLMPVTARELGVRNPYEPAQNIRGGVTYLAQLLDRFDGNVALSLAAYNAGPGAVVQHGGIPPYSQTQAYVSRVMNLRERYKGGYEHRQRRRARLAAANGRASLRSARVSDEA